MIVNWQPYWAWKCILRMLCMYKMIGSRGAGRCKIFLLTIPRRCFFCGSFVLSCFCYAFMRVCLLMPCGHLLRKGWHFGSFCNVLLWSCHSPIGILGQVRYLIVSIPGLCPFLTLTIYWNWYGCKMVDTWWGSRKKLIKKRNWQQIMQNHSTRNELSVLIRV